MPPQTDWPIVIDAHVHIFSRGEYADAGSLIRLADQAGIDILFCSSFGSIKYEMVEGNNQVREAMAQFPARFFGYANVPSADLGSEAVDEIDARVVRDGFRGVGEIITYTYSDQAAATGENWLKIYRKAADHRVPILAHQKTAALELIADAVPGAVILMAHMGNGDREGDWREAIRAARRHPNLYLETCSSTVDDGLIEMAVETVGAERVVFGSDLPLLNPHVQLAKVVGARIDDDAKRKILGGNMARLLGLTEQDLQAARAGREGGSSGTKFRR
jgi:uncharacterized protein